MSVKVEDLDDKTQENLVSLFIGGWKYCRFGDGRYIMPATYKDDADKIANMAVRPDDVWVVTFTRSGTTWSQELVWLLNNDLDYDTAAKIPLMGRYMFLEANHVLKPEVICHMDADPSKFQEFTSTMPSFEGMASAPSPRYIKSHMPFSLLPKNLLETTKVVYVARDPRDVAVSHYYHNRLFYNYVGDFKTYWNLFYKDLVVRAPFFAHTKEAWELHHHKNLLFLFYEDMTSDMASVAKRVAKFFDKEVTDEQIQKLCEHLDINKFRKKTGANVSSILEINPISELFIRKGKLDGWREYFDEEMTAQAESWLRENLADTDLRFPHTN